MVTHHVHSSGLAPTRTEDGGVATNGPRAISLLRHQSARTGFTLCHLDLGLLFFGDDVRSRQRCGTGEHVHDAAYFLTRIP